MKNLRIALMFLTCCLYTSFASAGDVYWEPYKFKGNEYFKYEVVAKTGNKIEKGIYVISVKKAGDKYRLHVEGKLGENEGSFTTTVNSPQQIPGALMGQAFFNPWLTPVLATVLGTAFLGAVSTAYIGTSWEIGSGWTTTRGGKKTSLKVESKCTYAGKEGKRLVHRENGEIKFDVCVAKGVALPIYMKQVKNSNSYYEAILKEYREEK